MNQPLCVEQLTDLDPSVLNYWIFDITFRKSELKSKPRLQDLGSTVCLHENKVPLGGRGTVPGNVKDTAGQNIRDPQRS